MTLHDKYGYCLIPPGSFLYRAGEISEDAIFFGLNPFMECYANEDRIIEMWETKKELKLLFMVTKLAHLKTKTALVDIYNNIFPDDQVSYDLHIKSRENKIRRAKCVKALRAKGVAGWLTSMEGNKTQLEVCLFQDANTSSSVNLVLKDYSDVLIKKEKENALYITKIFLPPSFEAKSKKSLIASSAGSYNQYFKRMNVSMQFDLENKNITEQQWKNIHYDLRLKLKM